MIYHPFLLVPEALDVERQDNSALFHRSLGFQVLDVVLDDGRLCLDAVTWWAAERDYQLISFHFVRFISPATFHVLFKLLSTAV